MQTSHMLCWDITYIHSPLSLVMVSLGTHSNYSSVFILNPILILSSHIIILYYSVSVILLLGENSLSHSLILSLLFFSVQLYN